MWVRNVVSTTVGINLPVGFSVKSYDTVNSLVSQYSSTHPNQWHSFASGWNAVAYRTCSAAHYDNQFSTLVSTSNSPAPEERLLQEQSLFGFFTSALASFESFYFAAYCFASIVDPTAFNVEKPKDLRVSVERVSKAFNDQFPSTALSTEMANCLSDSQFETIEDYRNVLSHRGVTPRLFFRGGEQDGQAMTPRNPKELGGVWNFNVSVDANMTRIPMEWLIVTLSRLFDSAEQFCSTRL